MTVDESQQSRYPEQSLDQLQHGVETPPTIETLEGAPPPHHGERREIPVPHPGERPGAVRADQAGPASGGTPPDDR
jgi:hypothetical protein